MIVGIGTDLVRIARIEEALQRHGGRFALRILSEEEIHRFRHSSAGVRYLAKRFAAKEAVAKALGCGIGAGARWTDIVVSNDGAGAPLVSLSDRALESAEARGVTHIHLSISDEQDYAIAFVVLSAAMAG